MAGVITPSMWVFCLRDQTTGHEAWCSLNEGLGKVLRYGAYGPEVIERLHWMTAVLGPLLQHAVRAGDAVDIKAIVAQMIQMGDEGHNRNRAGTLMFLREVLPAMIDSDFAKADVAAAVRFVSGNDHFFLNLVMPACKLQTRAAAGLPGSTVVTVMARNGTDFGIQTSGTGDTWFTAPANTPEGLFLGSYGPDDANPDIGDSAITETAGIGGLAQLLAAGRQGHPHRHLARDVPRPGGGVRSDLRQHAALRARQGVLVGDVGRGQIGARSAQASYGDLSPGST